VGEVFEKMANQVADAFFGFEVLLTAMGAETLFYSPQLRQVLS
jgi:hypothetical protein